MTIEITKEWLIEFVESYLDTESIFAEEGDEYRPCYEDIILDLIFKDKKNKFNEIVSKYIEEDDEDDEKDYKVLKMRCIDKIVSLVF